MNDDQKAQRSFGLIVGLIILALMVAATMDMEASTSISPISPPGTIVSAPFFSPPTELGTPWYPVSPPPTVSTQETPTVSIQEIPFCFGVNGWGKLLCY